jgi:uncharacterized protein with von Willebrand factor type A (vWA) domain
VLVYYFHNCPQGYLYRDPQGVEGVPIANVFKQLQPRVAGVLIISDGGAIRGNCNARREEQTRQFLTRARQVTRKIAWLNPLPPQRWTKTTAAAIARQVPMFEFDRSGLERAVTVLRGRER